MSNLTFKGYFRGITDGEQVKALVANRPHDDLFQNQLYLKSVLDSISVGKALIIRDQTTTANLAVGTPVYMDSAYTWRPAVAELSNDPNSTLYMLTEKAHITGIVHERVSTTVGHIMIAGQAVLDNSILDLIEGAYTEGIYYLSATYPGMITASKGVAPVRVGILHGPDANDEYSFIINPDPRTQLESHGHYRMVLLDAPAGEPNCVPKKEGFLWGDLDEEGPYPGIIHTVVNADSSLPGWLPADDPSFSGLTVPTGAKFGYNISADADLLEVWPPMPVDQVYIEVDGLGETDDLIVVNNDGIWWMDDAYGKAPWPVNMQCGSSSAVPADDSSSSSTAYPLWPVRIELWFTRVVHGTTLEAMSNQIALTVGIQEGLMPEEVGADVTYEYLTEGVSVYKFTDTTGSSSSSSAGVGSGTLLYKIAARDFSKLGRNLTLRFEVVAGAPDDAAIITIQNIINSFILRVTQMPASNLVAKNLSGIVTTALSWELVPSNTTIVPAGQYFSMRSQQLTFDANVMANILLSWDNSVIAGTGETAYLYLFRPVVELT